MRHVPGGEISITQAIQHLLTCNVWLHKEYGYHHHEKPTSAGSYAMSFVWSLRVEGVLASIILLFMAYQLLSSAAKKKLGSEVVCTTRPSSMPACTLKMQFRGVFAYHMRGRCFAGQTSL